ncbi:MAG TPA: penicillin-binding transpeptidase domain-containing protein, partial [Opitutales bacterium]|nr:penicillin-binding transpeptidase domain-containing protein [Opitutales bacterium]
SKSCGGLEQTFDFYLRGQNGWRQTERDGTRRELAQFRSREVESVPGLHAELSIDAMVQHVIEKELELLMAEYKPASATIIVSEPQTGYILGMANVPTFDPNNYNRSKLDEHRNRAITDVFEPGSTFKIVPISAALEQKIIELDAIIDCTRTQVEYRGRLVKLPKDHKPFDQLTVREVITRSSNRGVAHLACLMGGDALYK